MFKTQIYILSAHILPFCLKHQHLAWQWTYLSHQILIQQWTNFPAGLQLPWLQLYYLHIKIRKKKVNTFLHTAYYQNWYNIYMYNQSLCFLIFGCVIYMYPRQKTVWSGINRPFARSGHMARINYTGTQIMQWDFQNKGKSGWTGTSSSVLEVPLRNLRPSVIYSVPFDRIMQRAYWDIIKGWWSLWCRLDWCIQPAWSWNNISHWYVKTQFEH